MSDRPPQPTEMALIQRRREASKLSMRRAAAAARKSETWWRWKEAGYRPTSLGDAPEHADDEAVAVMARVARVTPDDLADAGRPEAARLLVELEHQERMEADQDSAEARRMVEAGARDLTARQRAALEGAIIDALREIRST